MSRAEELAQAYADAVSNHRIQFFYGEFKSYTLEMAKELDEAHSALTAELRRLAQLEAEHEALKKAISDAEPVAQWLVETEDGIPMFDCDPPTAYEISLGWAPLYTLEGIRK